MAGGRCGLQSSAAFQSVHDGHHHIADDDVGHRFLCLAQTFFAIGGTEDTILVGQQCAQEETDVGIVVDDERDGLGLVVAGGEVLLCFELVEIEG